MPTSIRYESPVFWTPTNINAKAATVNGRVNGQPFKLNFYWSGILLATRPEGGSEERLRQEISDFLTSLVPNHLEAETILHYQRAGDTFQSVADPGCTPAALNLSGHSGRIVILER